MQSAIDIAKQARDSNDPDRYQTAACLIWEGLGAYLSRLTPLPSVSNSHRRTSTRSMAEDWMPDTCSEETDEENGIQSRSTPEGRALRKRKKATRAMRKAQATQKKYLEVTDEARAYEEKYVEL